MIPTKKLGNNRCLCQACGQYFNSTFAFDKYRNGPWEGRYCDTSKMFQNKEGYWVTALRDSSEVERANQPTSPETNTKP